MKKLIFFLFIILLHGCAVFIPQGEEGYHELGIASWYGEPFHGRKTANGETYDMYGISAAHRTLPFGTMLRVTDRQTDRFIDVRVNDRGPFVHGRILDLSYGAAQSLGIVGKGVANVLIEVTRMESDQPQRFLIQMGSFADIQNANRVREKVEKYDRKVYIDSMETETRTIHRVRVGPFESKSEADDTIRHLSKRADEFGGLDMMLIRAD
jgi:rare lipoprotein A